MGKDLTVPLLRYIAQSIADQGGYPSQTRLVKLLYLIDVEYFRLHRSTLTKAPWICYKYGPYFMEFPSALKKADLESLADVEEDARQETLDELSFGPLEDIERVAGTSTKLMIDRVIEKWALEELNYLLNYVYFETEPMENAVKGASLDFSKIRSQPEDFLVSAAAGALQKAELVMLRSRLKESTTAWKKRVTETTEELRRVTDELDAATVAALQRIFREESPPLPSSGEIKLEEDHTSGTRS